MGKTRTTIEINGKSYDADSGHIISGDKMPATKAAPGVFLDGVNRKPKAHKSVTRSHTAAHKVHHKTSHSRTLMRHAVKKPQHTPIENHSSPQLIQLNPHQDPKRVLRATSTPKNPHISRFGQTQTIVKKFSPHLSVKEAPSEQVSAVSIPVLSTVVNPFHKALEHASSHSQARLKKPSLRARTARKLRVSNKAVNIAAASSAFVLLAGFFAYQNIPNLSMRVAAARAGVSASLPAYQPSGFSLRGPIKVEAGKITLTYHSNSDQRHFSLSQRSSAWNNETLLENFVATNRRPYQTYQARDKVIYMYDGSNATWINDGIWYQIEGESSLNSDQLLRIAASL